MDEVSFRRGMTADTGACFDVFLEAISDLSARMGTPWDAEPGSAWARLGSIYEFLGTHSAEWWVAENASGELIGYARSVDRAGLFELAEFFVRPGRQAAGVGRQLLELAFPAGRGDVRVIIATPDVRAVSRYYRAGTVARFPIASLGAAPSASAEGNARGDLEIEPATSKSLETLLAIERTVLDFDRGTDEMSWLLRDREGYVYRRAGEPVGFGFIGGSGSGPIAALAPADQPQLLLDLEARAKAMGLAELTFEVPMINGVAMSHLLGRGYRIDPFYTFMMTSRPFGQFDRYLGFQPPFIL